MQRARHNNNRAKEYVNCTLGFEVVDNYTVFDRKLCFANTQLDITNFNGKIRRSKAGGLSLTITGEGVEYDVDDDCFCNGSTNYFKNK